MSRINKTEFNILINAMVSSTDWISETTLKSPRRIKPDQSSNQFRAWLTTKIFSKYKIIKLKEWIGANKLK